MLRNHYFTRLRRVAAAAAVASLIALTAACGITGGDNKSSDSDDPIVIGMSLPLTGPVADRAKPGMEGYQYWVDELNEKGGLLGRKVELKVLDDGFDQQTAVSDYNRLISQDKVDLLLGTFSSDLNVAVAPIAERFGYVYVEPSGGADEIFERGFKYLFFAQPATTQKLPDRFVDLIESMPAAERPQTLALVQIDDPNTTQAAGLFKQQLGALGVRTVYDETYAPDTSNFDSIASSIKQKNPDLVINGAIAVDGMSLIQSMQKVGFAPKMLYQMNAPTDPTYVKTVGTANTEGIFTYLGWSPEATYPTNAGFVSGYTKKYGYAPSEDAANSYTAGQVLATAVKAVGSLDQVKIRDWLHANPVDTIVGTLKWDESGRPQGDMLLGQFQKGSIEIVAPKDAATTETVINPKPTWQ
ncbi:amino acid ABC transporter substrate-binding protein [Dactylosporangium sucinum]|uniref:Branched-chain amino acid ABC transporter substrate-binding protein n=1 Tax=Dactylosporangium sucinum TaxID=1424081 RepID=A0A917X6H6_9ACTN|nr:amino acid ABC transporter substrate-binding protein [Dactylosporangium sucinum]GGM78645.1 branched-chain amino acid ABC transporter substrate-binding protein [Dactylosporangium sucinum]